MGRAWRRVVAVVLGLVTALLGGLPAMAVETPFLLAPFNAYSHDAVAPASTIDDTAAERGPPAEFDCTTTCSALDRWSGGNSARSAGAAPATTTTYDTHAALLHVARATPTTQERARVSDGGSIAFDWASVAANTGPRALPTGPWGQKIVDARTRLPSSWGPGTPNAKGVGTRWFDPANKGNGIRIDQRLPGSSFASQQVDHVVVRSGGRILVAMRQR